jgi:hypothetical protein
MGTRLVAVCVDANDPAALARFWCGALGWVVTEVDGDDVAIGPDGDTGEEGAVPLHFLAVPESKTGKNRLHIDLASMSDEDQAATVERLVDLGASTAGWVTGDVGQGEAPWVVLADPEGNELCVLDPRDVYRDVGRMASIVVGCANPADLADFWTIAAGWDVIRREPQGAWVSLRAPNRRGPYIDLIRVPDQKTVKNRLHLDVAPFPDDDHASEVARLRALGARPTDVGQGAVTWVVLADPEGNELCVLTPR